MKKQEVIDNILEKLAKIKSDIKTLKKTKKEVYLWHGNTGHDAFLTLSVGTAEYSEANKQTLGVQKTIFEVVRHTSTAWHMIDEEVLADRQELQKAVAQTIIKHIDQSIKKLEQKQQKLLSELKKYI